MRFFKLHKKLIATSNDMQKLESESIKIKSDMRKTKAQYYGVANQMPPNIAGLIKRDKKTIARIETRLTELRKGFCPKGGLHKIKQTRSNQKMCVKCGNVLTRMNENVKFPGEKKT